MAKLLLFFGNFHVLLTETMSRMVLILEIREL